MDFALRLLRKIPFWRRYTTLQNSRYWKGREYGWEEYLNTAGHAHRSFISHHLKNMNWVSLVEVGCGSGPNLYNIVKNIPGRQVGGVDINANAIAVAKKAFKNGYFKVCSGDNIMMSDKSVDIVLTDMFLIYIGPRNIRKYLREIRRIARNYVAICEYHHKSWWERQKLRIFSGRHAYDYQHLLESEGFYDIMRIKVPAFEQDNEQHFRYLFLAKVPKH